MLAVSERGELVRWELRPAAGTVEDLRQAVSLLTSRKLDVAGTTVPLTARELGEALAAPPAPEVAGRARVWRPPAPEANERAVDPRAALAQLNALIAREPNEAGHYLLRGQAHQSFNAYERAAADYTRAIELAPADGRAWFARGLLRAYYQARGPEFSRNPAKLLAQWDAGAGDLLRALELGAIDPGQRVFVNEVCWPVVKSPRAGERRYRDALRLLEAACRGADTPQDYAILNTLGVAQYRAGRFADALVSLERSDALRKGEPVNWVFLAIAHHRLGRGDRGREFLAQVRTAMKDKKRAGNLELQQFLAEAELLIEGVPRQLVPLAW